MECVVYSTKPVSLLTALTSLFWEREFDTFSSLVGRGEREPLSVESCTSRYWQSLQPATPNAVGDLVHKWLVERKHGNGFSEEQQNMARKRLFEFKEYLYSGILLNAFLIRLDRPFAGLPKGEFYVAPGSQHVSEESVAVMLRKHQVTFQPYLVRGTYAMEYFGAESFPSSTAEELAEQQCSHAWHDVSDIVHLAVPYLTFRKDGCVLEYGNLEVRAFVMGVPDEALCTSYC